MGCMHISARARAGNIYFIKVLFNYCWLAAQLLVKQAFIESNALNLLVEVL